MDNNIAWRNTLSLYNPKKASVYRLGIPKKWDQKEFLGWSKSVSSKNVIQFFININLEN